MRSGKGQTNEDTTMTANMEILHKQIDALQKKNLTELQEQFEQLYGFTPGDTNAKNLRQRIAYRLQEITLGGLSEEDIAILDRIADNDPLANLQIIKSNKLKNVRGTQFRRIWHHKEYVVVSQGNGKFTMDGQEYSSLSAVAKAITGKKWNGRLFFGVPKEDKE